MSKFDLVQLRFEPRTSHQESDALATMANLPHTKKWKIMIYESQNVSIYSVLYIGKGLTLYPPGGGGVKFHPPLRKCDVIFM